MYGAAVRAVSVAGIAEGHKLNFLEGLEGTLCGVAHDDDLVRPHQVCSVGCLRVVSGRVVVDLVAQVLWVPQQFVQLRHVLPGFPQVQWPEVLVEGLVLQILHEGCPTLSILK